MFARLLLFTPAVFVALALTGALSAQPHWSNVTSAGPVARTNAAMAYDAARKQTILFGGRDKNVQVLGDTWAWDGIRWTKLSPRNSPPARAQAGMTYDAARQRIVLFGGAGASSGFDDVWEWDGGNWTQRSAQTKPAWRTDMGLAYDAVRKLVILFGGMQVFNVYNDTWAWNGSSWKRESPRTSPSARIGPLMTFHSRRRSIVLFGGTGSGAGRDTWEFDGINWTELYPKTVPPGIRGGAIVDDVARSRVVMFGGTHGTWESPGTDWIQVVTPARPNAQYAFAMAYDQARSEVVLFGGSGSSGPLAETWTYREAALIAGTGSARPGGRITLTLDAPADGGLPYQLGSSFGTGPIPIGQRRLGLSPDSLLVVSVRGLWPTVFASYAGVLSNTGTAGAAINLPNLTALTGQRVHTAFVTLDPKALFGLRSISNTFSFTITR